MKFREATTEKQKSIRADFLKDLESIINLQNSSAERVQQLLLTLSAGSFAVLVSLLATDLQKFVPLCTVLWFFYSSLLFSLLLVVFEYVRVFNHSKKYRNNFSHLVTTGSQMEIAEFYEKVPKFGGVSISIFFGLLSGICFVIGLTIVVCSLSYHLWHTGGTLDHKKQQHCAKIYNQNININN
jgi:hypothetical protein